MIRPVQWKDGKIVLIDQTLLPAEFKEIVIETSEQLWEAIRLLRVRGAPAIGIAAAYGFALEAWRCRDNSTSQCIERLEKVSEYLATSRPTAVNLFWALERMNRCIKANASLSAERFREKLLAEAHAILEEDLDMGRRIGKIGADLLKDGDRILTHCNAGALATGGYGTALGVVYAAKEQGKRIMVYADETRPLLQGSRLTAWELLRNQIDVTLICDNMAASIMRDKGLSAVVVGADRIAANGDFANKIGTYGLAVLAHAHSIPFYTAAPFSTIDFSTEDGSSIPIEMREEEEVRTTLGKIRTAPPEIPVLNPAFDVTPASLITGIITERGLAESPFGQSLRKLRDA